MCETDFGLICDLVVCCESDLVDAFDCAAFDQWATWDWEDEVSIFRFEHTTKQLTDEFEYRTVVETVLQILRLQPEACILLCAPSNPATDTLVQRLRTHLGPREMFRLNDMNRTFAEVPDEITQYTCKPRLFSSFPALSVFRIQITNELTSPAPRYRERSVCSTALADVLEVPGGCDCVHGCVDYLGC